MNDTGPTTLTRLGEFAALILLVCLCGGTAAAESNSAPVDYASQIKPILAEKCYSCHGRLKQESDLRLETRSLMIAGGVLDTESPADSELLVRVTSTDSELRMPPADEGAALKPDEIALLRSWITQGAVAPVESIPASPSEHWAFRKVIRPVVPHAESTANPIDAFLDEKRGVLQLRVQPEADRGVLLRRLYLDLVGLPPTLYQLQDDRPWAEIVDALLTSPHHGERWGRHWMDVWRYSDWYGLGAQLRYSQKHIWHWRDWIIESLNDDKGYDQMIREMLAADEIAPLDQDAVRATGFLARNYYLFNRTTWLDSTIEHTGKAFLGLTLNCAKCHDHKYDPITHLDYYRMRAIFEPHQVRLDPVAGVTDFEKDGLPRVFDDHTDARTFVHLRGNPKTPDQTTAVQPGAPSFLAGAPSETSPVPLPYQAFAPGTRDYVQRDRLRNAQLRLEQAAKALSECDADQQTVFAARHDAAKAKLTALTATVAADTATFGTDTDAEKLRLLSLTAAVLQAEQRVADAKLRLLEADDKKKPAAEKELQNAHNAVAAAINGDVDYVPVRGAKKALESPAHKEADYPETYSRTSTGRRTALARWITSRENPLTARVAVNHVWMRHFGEPLVASMFDFGLRTPRPANANLLDYLAFELMESGCSFRHLHRLIVTSKTYRLSSSMANADETTVAADPDNQFYWRANGRRMESQVLRDSLLHLAGELDATIGGPPVDANGDSQRRSVYFRHSRDDQNKFLKMFDDADLLQCYRRSESIVPQQALALSNSELAFDMATRIAARLESDDSLPDDSLPSDSETTESNEVRRRAQIASVFQMLLARPATAQEIAESLRFFAELSQLALPPDEATQLARFVHALLNHNDFITIR